MFKNTMILTPPSPLSPFSLVIPADYIRVLAEWLRLPVTTTSTALLYYYRFDRYRKDPIQNTHYPDLRSLDTLLFATCCVYLATKTTDSNRKIRDVLNCAHRALFPDQAQLRPDLVFARLRDSLLATELALLRILKFELEMDLAYWPAVMYVRYLFQLHPNSASHANISSSSSSSSSSSTSTDTSSFQVRHRHRSLETPYQVPKLNHVPASARVVLQIAWMLVSDAYLRSSVLQYAANDIALAAVFIAVHQLQHDHAPLLHELCDKFNLDVDSVDRVVIWMISTHLPERKTRNTLPNPQKPPHPPTSLLPTLRSPRSLDFLV
ncbi:Cyclin- protein fam58a [Coelomomyces lativittatus]|nr:Cyclin- protein fam58a [Coelomomyces lativittatus]KAJ1509017.1 Cyclin- protein fam58a [Coelomomyces lativittatus]KAJ1510663.1 Cyclin- protein fam58a [Coelomomyces lativittatus]